MAAKVLLIKEGNWTAFGQIGAALGTFLGIKILTSLLESSSYGMIALALTGVAFLHQILIAPLSSAVERFFPELPLRPVSALKEYMYFLNWVSVFSALLIAGTIYFLSDFNSRSQLLLASLAFLASSSVGYILSAALNSHRLRRPLALLQSSSEWLRYAFAGAFAYLADGSYVWVMYGFFLGSLCSWNFSLRVSVSQLLECQTNTRASSYYSVTTDCLRYAWPFCLWGIFTWIHYASDRWALALFGDLSLVGRFAALYQLGYYPQIILSGVILQLIAPIAYQLARVHGNQDESSMRSVRGGFILSLCSSLLLTFFVWLFCDRLYPLLVGQSFSADAHYWPIFVLAGGLFSAGQSASLKKMVTTETNHLLIPKIVTALFGTILNLVLIYFFGFQGAIFSLLIFSIIYCCWMTMILFHSEKVGSGSVDP